MQAIRDRMSDIQGRIETRAREIESLSTVNAAEPEEEVQAQPAAEEATADRIEEIRQSVTDESIKERVERMSQTDEDEPGGNGRESR
jgi:uncharacterized damage-inducible protein DinB